MANIADSLEQNNFSRKKINNKLREMNDGEPIAAPRLFVGKNRNQQVGLFIQDENGRDTIRIYVDEQNKTQMEFLDENREAIPVNNFK